MKRLLVVMCILIAACALGEEKKADAAQGSAQALPADWKVTPFDGKGDVKHEKGVITLCKGDDLTGVNFRGKFPRINYEISLEAMRVDGDDFFCGLTFPYKDSSCTFVVGGWGGTCVGLSCIDHNDAYNNSTAKFRDFEKNRWYRIRVRATDDKIEAWIDDEQLVDVETGDHKIDVRMEVEESQPLGVATWRTTGAMRNFAIIDLPGK